MEDYEIEKNILNILNGTSYELIYFMRDHKCFGNMIAQIRTGKKEYSFISDRGDIFCDEKTIFTSEYHVAGEDDSPIYLIKAIEQFIR